MNLSPSYFFIMYKFTEADLVPDTGKPATEKEFDLIMGYLKGMTGHWPDSLIEYLVHSVDKYQLTQNYVGF